MLRTILSLGSPPLIIFGLVTGSYQAPREDSKLHSQPALAAPSLDTGPLTGRLLQAVADGKPLEISPGPVLVEGKPFIYPPKLLRGARDPRRIDPGVSVRITLAKAEFSVLEPIPIKVEIRNDTDERKWRAATGRPYRDVHINVYDLREPFELLVAKTRYEGISGTPGGGIGGMDFPPGQSYRHELFVNLANDMTSPGEYIFFVEVATGPLVELEGKMTTKVAQSKELKIRIIDLPPVIEP